MKPETIEKELRKKAIDGGACAFVPIPTSKVVTANWVRLKCQFGCKNYGTRLTCPPYSPSPEETRKVLDEYEKAYLIAYEGFLGFDFYPPKNLPEAMTKLSLYACNEVYDLERFAFLAGYYKAFSFGAHRCRRCEMCSISSGSTKCKFPVESRPSMESAGMDIFKTASNAGIKLKVIPDKNIEKKGDLLTLTLLLLE